MKLKFAILILFSCAFVTTNAQLNLIKDGSFEDTTNLWQNNGGEGTLKHWHSLGSGNLINRWVLLSTLRIYDTLSYKLPNNVFFYQFPKFGNNIIILNILNYEWTQQQFPVIRSVIRNKLSTPLISGKQYCTKAFVCALDYNGQYFTNGFGMYADNGQLDTIVTIHKDSSGIYTFVNPQVQCNFLINDTTNWMKVQGVFTANGTEDHLTLGNFLSDSATWQVPNNYNLNGNVQTIIVDNVSLIPLDAHDWLPTTYYQPSLDSVWVGLDYYDYADGKWYDKNMQYITTGPGFWLKGPFENGKYFIHEIDICGVYKYDTTYLVQAPLSISNSPIVMNNLSLYPNPATNEVSISITNLLSSKETLQIVNATGKEVHKILPAQNITKLNIASLSNGIYFIKYGGCVKKLVVSK